MTRKRRVFGAAFKAKVALASVRGDKTTAQLAGEQKLFEQIGRLKMEVEWLKKKSAELA